MFNEIDENFDDVAIRTFKVGLLAEHDLRKSLTRKPIRSVCQLMDRIPRSSTKAFTANTTKSGGTL